MSFTLRAAEASDSPGVVRVIKSVYDEYGFTWDESDYHADLYDLHAYYFEAGHFFWVAERDGVMVGTVALEVFPALPGPVGELVSVEGTVRVGGCDCSLQRLYVEPSERRSGVGTALFELTVAKAKELGCQSMEIWSDKRFDKAHRLYQRYGAVVVGDRICDDPDVSPEWGLALELS